MQPDEIFLKFQGCITVQKPEEEGAAGAGAVGAEGAEVGAEVEAGAVVAKVAVAVGVEVAADLQAEPGQVGQALLLR